MKEKDEIKPDQIHQRKIELIKRDPLTQEWNKLNREEGEARINYLFIGNPIEYESDTSNRLEDIARELERKWNINLLPAPGNQDDPLLGLKINAYPNATVFDATDYIKERFISMLKRSLNKSHYRDLLERRDWIFFPGEGGFERGNYFEKVYIPILKGQIPIIIDPGGVNEKNITEVLAQVRNILKKRIKERKSKIPGQRKPLPQVGNPPELGFIYSSGEETFYKYLIWYDLKMAGGLSFRLIALCELKIPDKEKRQQKLKELSEEKKLKIGKSVRGESNVRTGFNKIFRAVHRTRPPSKESDIQGEQYSKLQLFACPDHPNT